MVERQKAVEVPEAMETDTVPGDVQLPNVDKMAGESFGDKEKPVGDAGENGGAPPPEGEMTTDGGAGGEVPSTSENNVENNMSTDDDSPKVDKKAVSFE